MRNAFVLPAGLIVLLFSHFVHADEPAIQSGSFDSKGVKIAYVTAGKGEPVVLVHGLYSSAEINWQLPGTFKLLAQHYQVIALDLRGHGQSDKPSGEDAYGQPMVDDIKAVKAPVEMLVGDHDPCKRLYVDPLHAVRGDWPVIEIDNAGHLNCIMKDQFKQGLKDWIDKNAGK